MMALGLMSGTSSLLEEVRYNCNLTVIVFPGTEVVQAQQGVFWHHVSLKTQPCGFWSSRPVEGQRLGVFFFFVCFENAEAHRSSKNVLESRIPSAFMQLFRTQWDYEFYTEPQQHAGNKKKYWPRGRVYSRASSGCTDLVLPAKLLGGCKWSVSQ
jgi:hypothetical protein